MNRYKQIESLPDPPKELSRAAVDVWYDIGNRLIEMGKLNQENYKTFTDLCFWEDQKFDVIRQLQGNGSEPLTKIGGENVVPTKASILLSNIRAIQIEIDNLRTLLGLEPDKSDDFSNVPQIPNEAYEHLPKPIRDCCKYIKDTQQRDTFLVLSLPVLATHVKNVLLETADGSATPDLFTFVVDLKNKEMRYVKKALEIGSALNRYYLEKPEWDDQALPLSLELNNEEFQEGFCKCGGKGLIFETNLEDALNSEPVESGMFSRLIQNMIAQKPVSVSINQQKRLIESPSLSVALYGSDHNVRQLKEAIGKKNFAAFSFYIFDNPGGWQSQRPGRTDKKLHEAIEKASQKMYLLFDILRKREQPIYVEPSDDHWEMIDSTFAEKMEIIDELKLPAVLQDANQYSAITTLKIAAIFSVIRSFSEDPDNLKNGDHLLPSESDMIAALWLSDTFIKHAIRLYQNVPESDRMSRKGERFNRFYTTLPAAFDSSEAITIAEKLAIPERTARRYLSTFTKEKKLKRLRKGVYQKI